MLWNSFKFYFLSFQIDSKNIKTFSDLPLSEETKKGLAECEYEVPTEIQKETLTLGLRGLDILGKIKSYNVTDFINWVGQLNYNGIWIYNLRYLGAYIFFKFASWTV